MKKVWGQLSRMIRENRADVGVSSPHQEEGVGPRPGMEWGACFAPATSKKASAPYLSQRIAEVSECGRCWFVTSEACWEGKQTRSGKSRPNVKKMPNRGKKS
jgi:hypothetical protein